MLVILLSLVVAVLVVSLGFWLFRARRGTEPPFVIRPPHDAPSNGSAPLRPDQPGFADAVVASVEVVGVDDTAHVFGISVKRVRRLRVLAGKENKSCASCEHWDLEEGQKFMREHPIVKAVTSALAPDQLGKKEGQNKQNWGEFGACLHHRVGMGGGDWCGREIHKVRFEKTGGESWA